ncbi:MAG: hypothetical protein R8K46_08515 [Mariprofundaceae bacterium]
MNASQAARIVTQPTITAQWQELVREAAALRDRRLDEDMESYLVFMLMRFTNKPDAIHAAMGEQYLAAQARLGAGRLDGLRQTGDRCLLLCGLFPEQAKRRMVKVSYFVRIGRSCYEQLADRLKTGEAALFAQLSETYVGLMDLLQGVRANGEGRPCLDPIRAFELWSDTGSRYAYETLTSGGGVPMRGGGEGLLN